jgi:hypothetical protein
VRKEVAKIFLEASDSLPTEHFREAEDAQEMLLLDDDAIQPPEPAMESDVQAERTVLPARVLAPEVGIFCRGHSVVLLLTA